jgi:hypothetical protein
MRSPLAPVIANFYMEYFDETALRTGQYKPTYWFRYVVLPHGELQRDDVTEDGEKCIMRSTIILLLFILETLE